MNSPGQSGPARFPWRTALTLAVAWVGLVVSLEWRNPRLVPSWHGFLHSAIVAQFMSNAGTRENPFFAGEPLPYYWVYHWLGAGLARLTGIGPLAALQVLALVSLAMLVMLAIDVGRRLGRSQAAGALIGFLALVGANPLGPVIAGARAVLQEERLLTTTATPVETVFVSDRQADDLMSRPLLGALYIGRDWRHGQNLVWFWDISSRAPALSALMLLLWALLCRRRLVMAVAAAILTSLNPVIGVTVCGTLGCTWVLLHWLAPDSTHPPHGRDALGDGVAIAAGVLLSLPTFIHLFQYGGAGGFSSGSRLTVKTASTFMNYGILGALALWAAWRAPVVHRSAVRAMTLAGLGLLGLTVSLSLVEGNEHNLVNAAAVVLSVPAALATWYAGGPRPGGVNRRALLVALLHVPMAIATVVAFDGRPPLPFRYLGQLQRLPADHPVARLYQWIGDETPRNAILVSDPDRPIKMSGNASELPAFTGRVLFVDQQNYLTRPHAAFSHRTALARVLLQGGAVSNQDRELLRELGRPIYLVVTDDRSRSAIPDRDGPPVFTSGFVAVFRYAP